MRWPGRSFNFRAGIVACAAVIFIGILLTQSRSGLLAASTIAAFQLGVALRLGRWTPLLVIGTVGVIVLLFPEVLLSLGQDILSEREMRVTGREERWEIAQDVILGEPLFGDAARTYLGRPLNYHNDLLQLAGYFGIPAALLFAAAIGRMLWFAWSVAGREDAAGPGWAMLLVVSAESIHGLFHVQMVSGIAFWMFVGLHIHNRGLNKVLRGQGGTRVRNPRHRR